jgi:four helix bundle protein
VSGLLMGGILFNLVKLNDPLKLRTMFLQLAHTKLNVYQFSQELALECYRVTKRFPSDEKFAMSSQIRRAALSVHLNIAEGNSRRSAKERYRYFEIARGSVIEVDSAIGIGHKIGYVPMGDIEALGELIIKTFKLLSGMMKSEAAGN